MSVGVRALDVDGQLESSPGSSAAGTESTAAGGHAALPAAVDEIETRILRAAETGDEAEFVRLADELDGGLERAQELVRAHGIVTRPAPRPEVA